MVKHVEISLRILNVIECQKCMKYNISLPRSDYFLKDFRNMEASPTTEINFDYISV